MEDDIFSNIQGILSFETICIATVVLNAYFMLIISVFVQFCCPLDSFLRNLMKLC